MPGVRHAEVGLRDGRDRLRAAAEGPARKGPTEGLTLGGTLKERIVPAALRQAGLDVMPASVLADEVLDLLASGASGEIRLRRSVDAPAVAIAAPEPG